MSAQTRDACNLKKPCPQAAQKRMANLCASEYVTVRIAAVKGLSVKKFKLAAEKALDLFAVTQLAASL